MTSAKERPESRQWLHPREEFLRYAFLKVAPEAGDEAYEIVTTMDGEERNAALIAWGNQWNLMAPWCKEEIIAAIHEGGAAWRQQWQPKPFKFSYEVTDPWLIGWKQVERDIKDAFRCALMSYRQEVTEAMNRLGFHDPKRKRNLVHFEWAARYQVGCESHEQIADAYGVTRQSVDEAVDQVLNLIELSQRPDIPAGQKKSRDTQDSA